MRGITRRKAIAGAAAAGLAAPALGHAQAGRAGLRGSTVVVNWPAHPHYDAAQPLLAEFTRETGIKVELDRMQYLRMHDKQVLEMSKPQGDYDVISYVVMWKTEYAARNFIEPLEPWFERTALAHPGYDRDDLITGYFENISLVGGPRGYLPGPGAKIYGIPFGAETGVLAYRRDILEKYAIAVPTTYDELLRACRTVKERERGMGGLTSRGQAGHQVTAGWLLHLTPHGGSVFDDAWRPVFNNAQGVRAAEVLKEIVDTGPPGIPSFGFGEMMNAFLQGQAAFYLDSISVFGPAKNPQASRIADRIGYAIHPKAVQHSAQTGGFGLAIPRNARNKDAAFVLIQWLTAKEQDKRIALAGGVASRWSTVRDAEARARFPEYAVLEEALKIANPDWRPIIPEWGELNEQVLGVALSEVITGRKAPKAALDEVVPKARAIMERGGYYKA